MPQPFEHPDDVILAGVVGSRAYGLAKPASDTDRLGVYVLPTVQFLGVNPPNAVGLTRVSGKPDVTYHEAMKLCRLLFNSNPTVTELLWLSEYEVATDAGLELVKLRSAFLCASKVRRAYFGYAEDQFERLFRRPDKTFAGDLKTRTAKHARHLLRLLHQGYGLYSMGVLQVKLDDPQIYHDFGDAVAADPGIAREKLAQYERLFDHAGLSPLPEVPDFDVIENWLLQVRLKHL